MSGAGITLNGTRGPSLHAHTRCKTMQAASVLPREMYIGCTAVRPHSATPWVDRVWETGAANIELIL